MKKKLILEANEVEAEVRKGKLLIDGQEHGVISSGLEKRRKESTIKVIVIMLVIVLMGSFTYVLVQNLFGSDDQSDPYLSTEKENLLRMKLNTVYPSSSLFLEGGSPIFQDLQDDIDHDRSKDDLLFDLDNNVTGSPTLNIVWRGNVDDLMLKGISVMEVHVDIDSPYRLYGVSFIVLGEDGSVDGEVEMSVPRDQLSTSRSGSNTYTIEFNRLELGEARLLQSGELSRNRACWISLLLPEGMGEGEHSVSASFGPEFYHESTPWDLFLGLIIGTLTLLACALVFMDLTRMRPALVVETKKDDLVLFGEEKDLSEINYQITKVIITKMREKEKRDLEKVGSAPEEFKVSSERLEKMKEHMKDLPGSPDKIMIQQCPECGSNELYYESGFLTGYVYHCKECDYIGSFIIEKELDFKDPTIAENKDQ